MMSENKKMTFHFVTIEIQSFFSSSDYNFFFMIFNTTESDSFVIIENSFSVITMTTFTQSVSVKFILINFIFNVANSFLKKKSDSNKKIHIEESFFFNQLILISDIHSVNQFSFKFHLFKILHICLNFRFYHKI